MYSSQASEKVGSAFEYRRLRLNEAFLHQLSLHTPIYLASGNYKWVGIARNSSKNSKSVKSHPSYQLKSSESSGTATAKQIYGEQIKNSWFVVPNLLGIKIWIEFYVDLKLFEHLREINKFNTKISKQEDETNEVSWGNFSAPPKGKRKYFHNFA